MKNRFELKKTTSGYHFTLVAKNGEPIFSAEGYNQVQGAKKGIESVRKNATRYSAYELRKSGDGKDYFVMKALNHEIIGTSEMYEDKAGMLNGIDSVMENAPDAPIVYIGFDTAEEE